MVCIGKNIANYPKILQFLLVKSALCAHCARAVCTVHKRPVGGGGGSLADISSGHQETQEGGWEQTTSRSRHADVALVQSLKLQNWCMGTEGMPPCPGPQGTCTSSSLAVTALPVPWGSIGNVGDETPPVCQRWEGSLHQTQEEEEEDATPCTEGFCGR